MAKDEEKTIRVTMLRATLGEHEEHLKPKEVHSVGKKFGQFLIGTKKARPATEDDAAAAASTGPITAKDLGMDRAATAPETRVGRTR